MSHVPEQPYEVPFRTADHGDFEDDGLDGFDYINGTGTSRLEEWWGTDSDWRKERKDILRRERARKKLGGFGFRT